MVDEETFLDMERVVEAFQGDSSVDQDNRGNQDDTYMEASFP